MQNPTLVLSSVWPFPPVFWWRELMKASLLHLDIAEHFEKMSYRNRYYIATAQGMHCLSIPLDKGRDQRASMSQLRIAAAGKWQQQHWRTLFSAYNRSPYFEYYKDDLEVLFLNKYERLVDFSLATIHWVKRQLHLDVGQEVIDYYQKSNEDAMDIRQLKPKDAGSFAFNPYNQVFEDRNGFIPHLSILDLLFNEGRYATACLKN